MSQNPASKAFSVTSLEECQDLFTNAPIGIFTSTPEGRLLSVNPAMARMFGRVEAGKMVIIEEEFKTKELVDSIVDLFKVTIRDKDLSLVFKLDPALPEKLVGDPTRLRQILFNLVGNALKYTDRGEVRLEITPLDRSNGDQRLLFTVSDTGIGIPQDRLKTLFQPFVQVDNSYTRRYQGAGLGLAIIRRLVDLMGGNISFESTEGQGTTVYVSLPFKVPEKVFPLQQQKTGQLDRAKKALHVLLAEDDVSNQYPLRKLLENMGHTVTVAEDGQQALDMLMENNFDCILMDIQMPVMDGVEATRRIRAAEDRGRTLDVGSQSWGRIPIIALTAYAMQGDREKFLEAGMDNYLSKPVRMEDLAKVLERNVQNEDD